MLATARRCKSLCRCYECVFNLKFEAQQIIFETSGTSELKSFDQGTFTLRSRATASQSIPNLILTYQQGGTEQSWHWPAIRFRLQTRWTYRYRRIGCVFVSLHQLMRACENAEI